uniref:Reverse transcriptase domain-containing protein n=1 Tax=Scophthalmus maximus TaxID=52904 RepID=A0A8D3BXZ9_SCOMX
INEFLTNCRLSTLDVKAVQALDAEITLDEIKTAVMQFPNNRASGPDGFKIEFYKSYLPQISILPNSLYQANIAVLLKKDRDPLNMSSYRPISLLQMETKILSKPFDHIHVEWQFMLFSP